jgi:multimeric flavodoxin WrbA
VTLKFEKLNALLLVATLKSNEELSNTYLLTQFLSKHLESYDTKCEILRLVNYKIEPGVYTEIGIKDEWPMVFEKILSSDILVFATLVWWGIQSSLMQRVIERLDEVHDEIMRTGKSKLANKVAGIVVTGHSDCAEHIIGNLTNFFVALGLTAVPFGNVTVLWSGLSKESGKTKEEINNYYEENYNLTAKNAARNLAFVASLLKNNPYPQ